MSKPKIGPWAIDPDAPQSITEMQMEAMRVAAEVEKVRLQEETKQRSHRRMTGDTRAWLLGSVALLMVIGGIVAGFSINGIENTRSDTVRKQQIQEVTRACVANGGEWKENLNGNFECVRSTP
jgi:hypothetical protein